MSHGQHPMKVLPKSLKLPLSFDNLERSLAWKITLKIQHYRFLLTITLSTLLSFSSLAQTSTTEVAPETGEKSTSRHDAYLGFTLGNSQGNLGMGATFGKHISENNVLETTYKMWSDRTVSGLEFDGAARVAYDGFAVGASNKYFYYNSFNVKGGLYYRNSTLDIPAGLTLLQNGVASSERDLTDIAGEISLGNHWFGKYWSLSVDWISYTSSIIDINKIQGLSNNGLQLLNFTISLKY